MIIVGLVLGLIAGMIMPKRGFGVAGDVIVGAVGAIAGGLLIGGTGVWNSILAGLAGAAILLAITSMFDKPKMMKM